MPESRRRKKKPSSRPVATLAPGGTGTQTGSKPGASKKSAQAPSPPWFGWMLLGLFAVGIAWLLTYYFSNGTAIGMSHLGGWNVAAGFAFILAGLGLATQWK